MNNRIQIHARFGDLNLQANADFRDEFIIISGENGAGKTTLLRCLAGLEKVEGQLIFSDRTWLDSSAEFVLPAHARQSGCVWADAALLPWLTVEKNITLGMNQVNGSGIQKLVEQLEITLLMQRKPHMLSTGEAQRVALARAILRKPGVLLLDEPFSAQAPAIRQRLRTVLKAIQLELNIAVLMVSHDVEDARQLADQHWRMREGVLWVEVSETEIAKTEANREKEL